MKVLAVNCSPRKDESTFKALEECMLGVKDIHPEIQTEILQLSGNTIHGCNACNRCKTEFTCSINDDFPALLPKFTDPDLVGLVIGTPVYLGSMCSQCKAFLDRSVMLRRNGTKLKNIVGGVLATGGMRNGGQELTIQTVQAALLVHDMVIVSDGMDTSHFGATIWNIGGKNQLDDEFGLKTARNLGKRIAEVSLRMNPSNS